MKNNAIVNYIKVRQGIDQTCHSLHLEHSKNTKCRNGCDSCCMNFSVLPVEFFSILSQIKTKSIRLNLADAEKCLFLVDHSCQIYEHRPSICRSHGLPILNMDAEGENWELSYCPLNFTDVEDTYFTLENGFQQDLFNSKLFLTNREFILSNQDKNFQEHELIELRRMKDFL
ncbi:MAG: YkgJ family cysteine cluster protein [Prolixibacteraceae bacterium]